MREEYEVITLFDGRAAIQNLVIEMIFTQTLGTKSTQG